MKLKYSLFKHKNIGVFLFILILGIPLTSSCSKETYSVLKLNIENKRYESLFLFTSIKVSMNSMEFTNGFIIPGKSPDGFKWTFIVPDSVNNADTEYDIRTQPFDSKHNEAYEFRYSANKFSDEKVRKFTLKKKVTHIKGAYTKTFKEDIGGLAYLLVDSMAINPKINCDIIDIKIGKRCSSDLEVQLSYPHFDVLDKYTFDKRLKIIKSNPSSTYLLGALPPLVKLYSKKEINLLFNSFLSEIRNSQEGQEIYNYINVEITPVSIDTLRLVSSIDNSLEPIIKDHSKYTLVIFSASWCGPCHEQIPLLKKVFNHCGNQLDMVYISSDRKEEEASWNQMIEKDEIPWRSLFARDYRNGLYKQYQIEGIPHSLLVHPNGKIETIDVRIKSEKDRLYTLMREKTL